MNVTGDWVQEHVEWLYGFRLYPAQLDDVMKFARGGIYALLAYTDYGKSMEIEIDTVLSLIRNANSREIVVKINDAAAKETSDELAMRLHKAAVRYPAVEPMIQWRNELPHNTGKGFWVRGAAFLDGRNTNRSVRCYGLGSRDLQGKRGRTKIDDIITEEEAHSEAKRAIVEARLDLVLRTLKDQGLDADAPLWALCGTPQYEGSPYERIPAQLRDAGITHEVIRRRPGDIPLSPSREQKIAIHKATMSPTAFKATYELDPIHSKRPTLEQVDRLIKHRGMPIPGNQREFTEWLAWELELYYNSRERALSLLPELQFFAGWDPATTGASAQAGYAKLQRHTWVYRAHLAVGLDAFDQANVVSRIVDDFPSSYVVIEKNAQQKAFRDVYEQMRPEDIVLEHGTYSNKEHGPISIPGMVQEMIDGYFHIPWQDEAESEAVFADLVHEIKTYALTSHPHIIPAIWFGWYWANKAVGVPDPDKVLPPGPSPEIPVVPPVMPVLMPITLASLREEEDTMRERSRQAWATTHESFR